MAGKNINYFLMDGTASGRIKCTIANWTGVAYRIPRTDLEKCREREDLKQSGVYFLFGADEDANQSVVYVGQAGIRKNGEGILFRLQEHKRNVEKDYWTETVVFTTSNNSFGPTEISWLENRFRNLAVAAQRYEVKNSNDPNLGNVTEEKESELEEFVEFATIVMGVMGHKLFEPLIHTDSASEDASFAYPLLYCRRSDSNAMGRLTGEGFVVLSGSRLRTKPMRSSPESAQKMREKYAGSIDEEGVLHKDILFKTPSGASCFVLMGSSNGYLDWATEAKIPLKALLAEK